jgi:2-desacetyl-2-hydroxyethyl bacteriochlorophyllide A dehydrogenase
MKAIRLHGPREARFEEIPTPRPGPDEVLVRVRAVAICATDIELFDGTMFYLTSGLAKYPFTPGHEWSGEVVELGATVRGFTLGDRVVGECSIGCGTCSRCRSGRYHLCAQRRETGILRQPGAMAEFICAPHSSLHRVNELPFDDAAFVEPTAVAVGAVRKARVTPADCVVIMGAGPIGLFALQVAKAYGAGKIIAVDRIPHRLKLAVELGADAAIDFASEDLKQRIESVTDGQMADVVIEAVGKKSVWPMIASIAAPGARVVMTGLFGGETCTVDFDPLVTREITVFGSLGSPNLWPEAIALHRQNRVRAERMITHRFPLSQYADAIEIARAAQGGTVKVLLTP